MKAKLFIPPIIERVLEAKATLAISVSGGADSEALTRALVAVWRERGWPGKVFLVHANLGRAEWPETLPHVERISRDAGLGLEVVRRAQGDLVAQWQERQRQLVGTGTPFWSSSGQRYCTSGQKRDQINRVLRRFSLVISAEGIRAEESTERSEKQPLIVREKITAERLKHLTPEEAWTEWQASHQAGLWQDSDLPGLEEEQGGDRLGLTWYPLFNWSKDTVWEQCGTSSEELERCRALYQSGEVEAALASWPCHPCYVYGQSRCSCCLCVLSSRHDLEVGAKHNPDLLRTLAGMEHLSAEWLAGEFGDQHGVILDALQEYIEHRKQQGQERCAECGDLADRQVWLCSSHAGVLPEVEAEILAYLRGQEATSMYPQVILERADGMRCRIMREYMSANSDQTHWEYREILQDHVHFASSLSRTYIDVSDVVRAALANKFYQLVRF